MKKRILMLSLLAIASSIAGCSAPTSTTAPAAPAMQVGYAQACAAYGAAFSGVLQLRKAGKLDAMQVSQVSLIDSQITPICTRQLPADANEVTQQITAAVTALTIMETLK